MIGLTTNKLILNRFYINSKKCPCCDSNNISNSSEDSYFNMPVMKCSDCGHNFTLVESKEQLKKLY